MTSSPSVLPMAVRMTDAIGSLCVPSPRAMKALRNGTPSIVPETVTSPRVPNTVAESGSFTQVQVSPGLTRPIVAVNVMSSGPTVVEVCDGLHDQQG